MNDNISVDVVNPDRQHIRGFMGRVWPPSGAVELRSFRQGNPPKTNYYTDPRDLADAAAHNNGNGWDVYFTAHQVDRPRTKILRSTST